MEIDSYPLAILYAGMGDQEGAMIQLQRAFEQHSPNMIYIGIEPFLDPVREHPDYAVLQAALKL